VTLALRSSPCTGCDSRRRSHPSSGQLHAGVVLVQRELLGIRKAQAGLLAAALEGRVPALALEKTPVGRIEPPQRLLQRVDRRLGQPGRLRRVAPVGEPAAHGRIGRELLAGLPPAALFGDRGIPHPAARARVAAQRALDTGRGAKLEAQGLHRHDKISVAAKPCSSRALRASTQASMRRRELKGPLTRARTLDLALKDEACRATGQTSQSAMPSK
jgi:hypothetical protein